MSSLRNCSNCGRLGKFAICMNCALHANNVRRLINIKRIKIIGGTFKLKNPDPKLDPQIKIVTKSAIANGKYVLMLSGNKNGWLSVAHISYYKIKRYYEPI